MLIFVIDVSQEKKNEKTKNQLSSLAGLLLHWSSLSKKGYAALPALEIHVAASNLKSASLQ